MINDKSIIESIDGAASVINFYRNAPDFEPMKNIGEVEVLTPAEAVNRAAALYGTDPNKDAFKALMSPFKGATEILQIELVNISSTNQAKTVLKKLDDAFKEKGLDLKEQTYPILDMTPSYPSSYGNGNVMFIAFVPVIKSPDKEIENNTQNKSNNKQIDLPKTEDPKTEDPKPEPDFSEPAAQSEPNKETDTKPEPESKPKTAVKQTKQLTSIHVGFRRKNKISDSLIDKRLKTIALNSKFDQDNKNTFYKEGSIGKYGYTVFLNKSKSTTDLLRFWKQTGRCAVPSKKLIDDISLNDLCLCIGFVFDTRTFDEHIMKTLVKDVLADLQEHGLHIRQRKAFIVSVGNPYLKNPTASAPTYFGKYIILPFCSVLTA